MQMWIFGLFILLSSLGLALHAKENVSSKPQVIILLGPPGSGKGTQATRITKELGIPHISTGDLFRENMSKNTELGQRAKSYMDKGQLVPDEVVLDMLFDRVSKPDCANGYLLDGFPRTVPQAEALDKFLANRATIIAVNLDVADESIFKRMAGRLNCKQCGNIQNKYISPPRVDNICDKCGGELYQRSDDNPEVVKERLKVYHAQTEPVIAYYKKKGVLIDVNGEQAPDAVFSQIMQDLKD